MSDSLNIQHLFGLEGKVALVTGGSRGIGFMIAQGLLEAGARVYISARKAEACLAAAEQLSKWGSCIAVPADVADEASRLALRDQLMECETALDILVNNAGTAWGAAYEDYPQAGFDKVMSTNVSAVFALTRDLTPLLEQGVTMDSPSRVINIGSMEGLHIPTVHSAPNFAYTASKAAVHHLTRHLAVELGERHITVNAIAPGFFPSKMTEHILAEQLQEVEANALIARAGRAEEMAGITVYLCGRGGAYTTGTVIPVDGGTLVNHRHGSGGQS
ncbi:3-oxoacyl-ACP reductase [Halioglobus japonicus]|uniref:KR domain-containing protein n=1 Tax=Halioglobus japonicus TaxID=930805 RepID=A0AAP8MF45_9GAMM|nr:SDR family oxidoreductase [Halioglobus japonicus]PLW86529.1 KR domain-containing protein [Halioglobus japonicus]GHD12401.1 3-oxoacyl-ACP reductase [Halioglobus japonicus]